MFWMIGWFGPVVACNSEKFQIRALGQANKWLSLNINAVLDNAVPDGEPQKNG